MRLRAVWLHHLSLLLNETMLFGEVDTVGHKRFFRKYAPNKKPNYIKTMRKLTCIQLQNTYKEGTAYCSTNHKKTGKNFNYFCHGFDDFFSAFIQPQRVSNFTS